MIEFGKYGQERELDCTPEEQQIFDIVSAAYPNEDFRLVRVSDDYVTVKRGKFDIVRIKYTERAKWVMFPSAELKKKKHYIEDPSQVTDFTGLIDESLEYAKKYE